MLKFIFKRLLEALPTLFILITFSFFLMRLAPGSPFTSERAYPPEVMANIEAKYHLNEPLYKQYFLYLENLSKGDFGPSFKYKDQSVNDLIASAFPVSIKLGMAAFAFAVVLGVTAGTLAALNQNSRWDYILMSFSMLGVIMPSFVFAPVLVLIFAIYLGWLPAGGWNGGTAMYMILPVASLTIAYVAGIARIMRGSMIEVLHSNFIRTAKAKGLSMSRIIFKTCFASRTFTRDNLFRTCFRRDYYRLNGHRKRIWFTWHGIIICKRRIEPRLLFSFEPHHFSGDINHFI